MNNLNIELSVYLLDDDDIVLKAVSQIFELGDFKVKTFNKPQALLKEVNQKFQGVIVSDVRMPSMDGIELFERVQKIDPDIPVIFITGHADVPMVLNALHDGAFDFFSKPVDSDLLQTTTRRALNTRRLILENRQLKENSQLALQGSELIGESLAIQRLRTTISQIALTEMDVLIEGETGTGKELVASLIHQSSTRSARPLIKVKCAALSIDNAEAELFGSAYAGKSYSNRAHIGKVEASHNNTLFLDEIDSLPESIQRQLIPIIEDRKITPSVGDKPRPLNLRIITSSQIDLSMATNSQQFRGDLFYRLNTIKLTIPPLRERKEDVPLLFAHFISQAAEHFSKKLPTLTNHIRIRLTDYDWPGNVRELKNFAYSTVLGINDIDTIKSDNMLTLPQRVERFEASTIKLALEQTKGDVRKTLDILSIPRKTFYDKLTRHQIDIDQYRKKKTQKAKMTNSDSDY